MNDFKAPYTPGIGSPPQLPQATVALTLDNSQSHSEWNLSHELYRRGFFWECHEVLESLWRLQPEGEIKVLIQALIQRSASQLKRRMGDNNAADRLAVAAEQKLRTLQDNDALCKLVQPFS